eukprot:Seg1197.1 transcript_id=Seg1197.1/GoldUCD/mRNA.D3Y31 product="hypothetical protein" protein_id=Seg1197.1/GoldUCD/D3Y31
MTRSGAAAATLPKCKYFEQMAFLHEKSANKPTQSNLSTTDAGFVLPAGEPFSSQSSVPSPRCNSTAGKRKIKTESKRAKCVDLTESDLNQSLIDCDNMIKKSLADDDNEDSLYCRSLIPILKDLPKKKKRLAKIKISQLLFDLEYSED